MSGYGILNAPSPSASHRDPSSDDEGATDDDESVEHSAAVITSQNKNGDSGSESGLDEPETSQLHAHTSPQQQPSSNSPRLTGSDPSIEDLLSQTNSQDIEHPIEPTFADLGFSLLSDSTRSWSLLRPTFLGEQTYAPPFSLGQAVSKDISPTPEPTLPVSNAEKTRLICSYMQETGTWCGTTDSDMEFTMRSIYSVMKSTVFIAAANSLASRQLDHVERRQRPVTLELYQYTIQLLLQQDPAKADLSLLATCTLLCVYEMMASGVYEWRRHLKVIYYLW